MKYNRSITCRDNNAVLGLRFGKSLFRCIVLKKKIILANADDLKE